MGHHASTGKKSHLARSGAAQHVQARWASGQEDTVDVAPSDTIADLKRKLARKHKTPPKRILLLQGTRTLLTSDPAAELSGQTIDVIVSSEDILQARVSKPSSRRIASMPSGHYIGERVVSKINFVSDDGSVSVGDVGVVTGPGILGEDALTVDFAGIQNIGVNLKQVDKLDDEVNDGVGVVAGPRIPGEGDLAQRLAAVGVGDYPESAQQVVVELA
jgi:hypothetical protein